MNQTRREALARKRERLILECAVQRVELGYFVERLGGPISVADRVIGGVRAIGRHPLLLIAGVGFLIAFNRSRVLRMGGRAWAAWRLYRSLTARRAAGALSGMLLRAARKHFPF